MFKHRWTIKELAEMSDTQVIQGILNERLSGLNPYAPLASRLKGINVDKLFYYNELKKK